MSQAKATYEQCLKYCEEKKAFKKDCVNDCVYQYITTQTTKITQESNNSKVVNNPVVIPVVLRNV